MGLLYPMIGIPMKPNQFYLQGLVHFRRYLGSLCSSVPLANLELKKPMAGPMNCSSENMYVYIYIFMDIDYVCIFLNLYIHVFVYMIYICILTIGAIPDLRLVRDNFHRKTDRRRDCIRSALFTGLTLQSFSMPNAFATR